MPRAPKRIRKRYVEGMEILDSETEMSLLLGFGLLGPDIHLRTRDDWQRYWEQWRDVVLPKAIEHRPGLRPFVCYVLGELPERPVLMEPPLANGYFKLYVPARDGTGSWHYRYPEPYQRSEADYLFELGVIDRQEMKRHREWRKHGLGSPCGYARDYPYEQGLYV